MQPSEWMQPVRTLCQETQEKNDAERVSLLQWRCRRCVIQLVNLLRRAGLQTCRARRAEIGLSVQDEGIIYEHVWIMLIPIAMLCILCSIAIAMISVG